MRALLNQQLIWARSGSRAIEVWPCTPLLAGTYNFAPMNESCTREIPIEFTINGKLHKGFLDPKTDIISNQGFPSDCALVDEVPILHNGTVVLYQRKTGYLQPTANLTQLSIIQWNATDFVPTPSTVYHQIVMYSWGDLQTHVSLNDLMSSISSQQQLFARLGVTSHHDPEKAAQQAIAGVMNQGFFGFLRGFPFDPYQVWVFFCCLIFSFQMVTRFLAPAFAARANLNLPGLVMPVINQIRNSMGMERRNTQDPPDLEMGTRSAPSPAMTPPPGYETTIVGMNTQSATRSSTRLVRAPNRQSLVKTKRSPSVLVAPVFPWSYESYVSQHQPIRVAPADAHNNSFPSVQPQGVPVFSGRYELPTKVAPIFSGAYEFPTPWEPNLPVNMGRTAPVIRAKIGGVGVTALADTGASVSLISEKVARSLKVRWEAPRAQCSSMTSHQLRLMASARASVTVGTCRIMHRLHVLKDAPSNCIIGSDILAEYGAVTFNFAKQHLAIEGQRIPFVTKTIPENLKVTAPETMVLPSRTETLFVAHVAAAPPIPLLVAIEPNEAVLRKTGLYLARSLNYLQQGRVTVRIMNPHSFPIKLFKGMAVGRAEPAIEATLVGALNPPAPMNQMNPPVAPDLTKSGLNPVQKDSLNYLIRQYTDVFAKDDFDLRRTPLIKHHSDTGTNAPVRSRPYRIPEAQKPIIKQHIDKMLQHGIISPSTTTSPWSSPVVLVKKKLSDSEAVVEEKPHENAHLKTEIFDSCAELSDSEEGKAKWQKDEIRRFISEAEARQQPSTSGNVIPPSMSSLTTQRSSVLENSPIPQNSLKSRSVQHPNSRPAQPELISHYFPLLRIDIIPRVFATLIPSNPGQSQSHNSLLPVRHWLHYLDFNYSIVDQISGNPAICRMVTDFVLSGLQWEFTRLYLDDVLVYSTDFDTDLHHLEQVLKRLRKYNLKLKKRKCYFCHSEVEFLGHLITIRNLF